MTENLKITEEPRREIRKDSDKTLSVTAVWVCSGKADESSILQRYLDELLKLPQRVDITIVVNGDSSIKEISDLVEAAGIPGRLVKLHRASGESELLRAGLNGLDSDVILLLPSYLQSDPKIFGEMIDTIANGADFVASWRSPRIDSRWSATKSAVFNRMTQKLTGVKLHDINSELRAMKCSLAQHLPIYGDLYRFLPVLASMQGFKIAEIKVQHLEERVEKGDYRFGVYVRRILDLITLFFLLKFTKKPLRFFGLVGTASIALGASLMAIVGVQRLFFETAAGDRPLFLLGVLFPVLGVQLFSLGLLGELIIFTRGRKI